MKNPDMRTSRMIHGWQYHSSFLSLDSINRLVFLPSLPQPEHLPRMAASCEKEHRGYWGQVVTTQIYEILTRGVDARDIPVACSKPDRPVCPHRPCWRTTDMSPSFRTQSRPARRPAEE